MNIVELKNRTLDLVSLPRVNLIRLLNNLDNEICDPRFTEELITVLLTGWTCRPEGYTQVLEMLDRIRSKFAHEKVS